MWQNQRLMNTWHIHLWLRQGHWPLAYKELIAIAWETRSQISDQTRGQHPAMGLPGPLPCPLKSEGGQQGARAKFGDFLDFLVLKTVQRGSVRGGIMASSGQSADIKRPSRPLSQTPRCLDDCKQMIAHARLPSSGGQHEFGRSGMCTSFSIGFSLSMLESV